MFKKPMQLFSALVAIGAYFTISAYLFGMDLKSVLNNTQLISVTFGIVLLTASQYKWHMALKVLVQKASLNAFMAGGITSLFTLMYALNHNPIDNSNLAKALLPLLYASLWYAILSTFQQEEKSDILIPSGAHPRTITGNLTGTPVGTPAAPDAMESANKIQASFAPEMVYQVLIPQGFTPREMDVAIKILNQCTNKEIADMLFISESTVKKHIQNMFRKCGATDKQDFFKQYTQWFTEYFQPHTSV